VLAEDCSAGGVILGAAADGVPGGEVVGSAEVGSVLVDPVLVDPVLVDPVLVDSALVDPALEGSELAPGTMDGVRVTAVTVDELVAVRGVADDGPTDDFGVCDTMIGPGVCDTVADLDDGDAVIDVAVIDASAVVAAFDASPPGGDADDGRAVPISMLPGAGCPEPPLSLPLLQAARTIAGTSRASTVADRDRRCRGITGCPGILVTPGCGTTMPRPAINEQSRIADAPAISAQTRRGPWTPPQSMSGLETVPGLCPIVSWVSGAGTGSEVPAVRDWRWVVCP